MNKIFITSAVLSLLASINLHATDRETCLEIGSAKGDAIKSAVTACVKWHKGWAKSSPEREEINTALSTVKVGDQPGRALLLSNAIANTANACPNFAGSFKAGATVDSKECKENVANLLPMLAAVQNASPQASGSATESKPAAKTPETVAPAATFSKPVGSEKLYRQTMARITNIKTLAKGKNDTGTAGTAEMLNKLIDKACVGADANADLCETKLVNADSPLTVLEKKLNANAAAVPAKAAAASSTAVVKKLPTKPTRSKAAN